MNYLRLTDDEMFTDSFKIIKKDGIIEIEAKMVSEKSDIDDSLIGGNASAEEATEGAESNEVKGFDVVIQNRLVEMPAFDKKGYLVSNPTISVSPPLYDFGSKVCQLPFKRFTPEYIKFLSELDIDFKIINLDRTLHFVQVRHLIVGFPSDVTTSNI